MLGAEHAGGEQSWVAGWRCWKKDPATGRTFWLILNPGQRERGFRKGRVKEAARRNEAGSEAMIRSRV
jgi:hypothetical protein